MDCFDLHGLFRPALVAIFMLTVFACDGGGCSGCEGCGIQPIPGAYPIEHRIDNSAQVRLTSAGIGFVEDNISDIVGILLPDGLDFAVPPTSGSTSGLDYDLCPDGDCFAHGEIDSFTLTPEAPNRLRAHIRVTLDSRDASGSRRPIPVRVDPPILPASTCDVDIDSRRGDRPHVGLIATIDFVEDTRAARQGYTRIEVSEADLADGEDIENDDIDIGGCGYAFLINLFKGTLVRELQDQVSGLIQGVVSEQLCTTRGEFGCPTGTFSVPDEDPDSVCRFENNEDAECVPILLGMDGQGDLGGQLIGGFSPGTHAYAQFLLAAGGDGHAVNEGMTLDFYGGFRGTDRSFTTSPAHHPCVPMVEPPPLPEIAEAEAFRGNTIPGSTDSTHVGIGLAEDYLDYAGYGLFDSGMLCIGAGTRLSQQLSTGLVSAAIMSLPDLTFPDSNVPLTIAVRPQQPPDFTIGAGTAEDPILQVTLPEVQMDFYVWSTERYVRFMTFQTDLEVGVNLSVADNQLVPEITSVTPTNSSVSNSDLLAERPEALAGTLETVINSFAGMLTSGISPFDLPEIMGFNLEVPENGIIPVMEGDERFLGIFANLSLADGGMAITAPVETSLEVSDLELDEASMRPEGWAEGPGNRAWLHFGSEGPLGVEYEYSYRIDGGLWSPWTTDERIRIDDDVLLLQARHEIEARARIVGEPGTVDQTPATSSLVVDILPPTVQVNRTPERLEVVAQDIVTSDDELEYRYRIDGVWTAWTGESSRELPTSGEDVVVEVRDEAGNVGSHRAAIIRGLPNSDAGDGCGCAVPGGGDDSRLPLALLGLLGGLGVVFARRRRRKAGKGGRAKLPFLGVLMLSGLALVATGCDCNGEQIPCGGTCTPARPPGTPTGSVCCEATDMCAPYDANDLCEPGYFCPTDNVVADEACEVSCSECMVQPALDSGTLATHLDMVVGEGGEVWISGYSPGSVNDEMRYGDLVFGTWNGSSVDWEIVDGAPSAPITNDPDGWRGGVSDPGDDVGRWTSMVQLEGTFLITYYDRTNRALKLAAGGPGAWETHTIDEMGDAGRYASLVLTDGGVPVVSYLRIMESADTPGTIVSSVMVATANLANPSGPTDWTLTEVNAAPMDCRPELCPDGTTCLESGTCVMESSDCSEECGADQVCFNTACEAALPSAYVEDLPPAVGLYTSLAAMPGGGLALVYYDRSSGNIYGTAFDGSAWSEPFLIDGYAIGDPFVGDSGMSANLAVDSSGVWHVAYVDGAEETLRYAQVQSDGTVLTREVVDDGSTDGMERHSDGRHIVGDDASIVALEGGGVRVAYQDATSGNAVIAVRPAGGGDWAISHFDSEGSTGYWVDQELLGTTSYLVTWWRAREGNAMSNGIRVFTTE
ncbi:MAG TPA: MYXO-CTERM sorting domain-containing protein [Sandaracinaceae bacterium LLY-WYZ-13_1]|nr:MYXO-CTERM sorting domain-containing protein [Sandaracinaceae bacterium LLY-WYZ-13_1]